MSLSLTKKLDAMDARSSHGPWTWDTLREIGENPGLALDRAGSNLNRERYRPEGGHP